MKGFQYVYTRFSQPWSWLVYIRGGGSGGRGGLFGDDGGWYTSDRQGQVVTSNDIANNVISDTP